MSSIVNVFHLNNYSFSLLIGLILFREGLIFLLLLLMLFMVILVSFEWNYLHLKILFWILQTLHQLISFLFISSFKYLTIFSILFYLVFIFISFVIVILEILDLVLHNLHYHNLLVYCIVIILFQFRNLQVEVNRHSFY